MKLHSSSDKAVKLEFLPAKCPLHMLKILASVQTCRTWLTLIRSSRIRRTVSWSAGLTR